MIDTLEGSQDFDDDAGALDAEFDVPPAESDDGTPHPTPDDEGDDEDGIEPVAAEDDSGAGADDTEDEG